MSEMYGQTEKALSKGADYVDQARGDVKNKCGVLSGNIQTMMAGWGGQGASAFNNLMISWDQKQETILKALDQLSAVDEGDRARQRLHRREPVRHPHQPPGPSRLIADTPH